MVNIRKGTTFATKLEILILFILNEYRVVKRGVHFFRYPAMWANSLFAPREKAQMKRMCFYKFFEKNFDVSAKKPNFAARKKCNNEDCPKYLICNAIR